MPPHLLLLSPLTPPSPTRTWQTVPHPTLPLLATASSDKTVRIYSLSTFILLNTVSGGHKRSVRAVAWQPNTPPGVAVLATGSFDASAGIWRKDYHTSGHGNGAGGGGMQEIDIMANGGGGEGAEDNQDDEYTFSILLDGHDSEIKSLSFSPHSRLLATCARDKSVWIWEELDDDNYETVAVLQEHDGDVKCVAWHPGEDLLASASYDDTVRLYREDVDDWVQVAVLEGHAGSVWWVGFEGGELAGLTSTSEGEELLREGDGEQQDDAKRRERRDEIIARKAAGPRLVSCSDDKSILIWRRRPVETQASSTQATGIPSIIRSHDIDEVWEQEARLPEAHERAIYSVGWSARTGLLVSAGSDGRIVVYREVWVDKGTTGEASDVNRETGKLTEWVVLTTFEAAHGVFEINHVTWAPRRDKSRRRDDEEVIVSTGDDGEVRVWTLEEVE